MNNLDDNSYAIKKIPLSFNKLKHNFNKTLEKVLREVKLLARISHPNIIRYYNSWIELKEASPKNPKATNSHETLIDVIREDLDQSPEIDKLEKDSSFEICWDISDQEDYEQRTSFQKIQKKYAKSFNLNEDVVSECSEITIFIQMELCEETLEDYLLRRNSTLFELKRRSFEKYQQAKKTFLKEAKTIFHQIIAGLLYIHNNCFMVHRDLKPSNIFLNRNLVVKLGDFGLAKQLQPFSMNPLISEFSLLPNEKSSETLQENGTFIYTSPEQSRTHVSFDERADIYSLGIIALRLFHPMATMMEFFDVVKSLKEMKMMPDEKKELSEILMKMISEKPHERPNLKDIKEVFDRILEEESLECKNLGMNKVKYEGNSFFVEKWLKIIQKKLYVFAGKDEKKAEKVFILEDCNVKIDQKKEAVIIEHPFQLGCSIINNDGNETKNTEELFKMFQEEFGDRTELINFCFWSDRSLEIKI